MYGDRRPEFDPDQFLRDLRTRWERLRVSLPGGGGTSVVVAGVVAVLAVIWLATGVYQVSPEEQAAVRIFGKYNNLAGPGLHWNPPAPIGTRNIEKILQTKKMEVGFRDNPPQDVESEARMITGDLNIVDVQMVVQYRIVKLQDFLFNVDDPGDPDRDPHEGRPDGITLRDATEASLREVVGQRGIDDVLTVGRELVQQDTRRVLQRIVDSYGAGIEILQVVLQNVRPPDVVRPAFEDVVKARVDKEGRINQGRAYEQDRLPRARGAAQQVVQAAEAFRQARIARSRGEAAQFLAVLGQYEKSRDVTRQRLYLETMEQILPGISLFIIDPEAGSGILPYLPLTALTDKKEEQPTSAGSAR